MLSLLKVSEILVKEGVATATFGVREYQTGKPPLAPGYGLSDETYGNKSMMYLRCPDKATRHALEAKLTTAGVKVDASYDAAGTRIEFQVSYFRGYHWDE